MKLYPVFDNDYLVGTFSTMEKAEAFIEENQTSCGALFVGNEHELDDMVGFRLGETE